MPDPSSSGDEDAPRRWWHRKGGQLEKSRGRFAGSLRLLRSGSLDDSFYDGILDLLIEADVGYDMAERLEASVRLQVQQGGLRTPEEAIEALKSLMVAVLRERDRTVHFGERPGILMLVGVNGNGKTTTIGKFASLLRANGRSVLIAAADTFRAAAKEQLAVWAERSGAAMVAHQDGADPGAVVFDAIAAAIARGTDVVLVDTAGRLHTKGQLMAELGKIDKVVASKLGRPCDETLLVLEAVTGMNALSQAKEFASALRVTGLVLTKLDGSSKGGMVFAIEDALGIPVKLAGVGEGIDDLQFFDPQGYCDDIFSGYDQPD